MGNNVPRKPEARSAVRRFKVRGSSLFSTFILSILPIHVNTGFSDRPRQLNDTSMTLF